jgi:hypothetical protein
MIICQMHIPQPLPGKNGYFYSISCGFSHPDIRTTLRLAVLTSEIMMNIHFCSKRQ